MGCVSYAWFPFFAAASAVGLGVARYFYPLYVDTPPLFPLCHYIVNILYLVTILSRYIYVDKIQPTFWNGLSTIIGLMAVITYIARIQLISSRTLVMDYGVGDELLEHIEEGLRCVMPFTTNLYCILQTVVSYKTRGSSRYTGPCMRACRVLISVVITPVAHYLIFTHVTTHMLTMEGFGFLVTYYHYVYWAFGGLTSLFVLGLASELFSIRSYCGCLVGKCTATVSPMGMVVTTDDAVDAFTAMDTEGGKRIYLAKEGCSPDLILRQADKVPCLSYVWLPVLTGFSAVGLHLARHYTGDLLTVTPIIFSTPMFPYLDHAVAFLFLLTIIVRCAHVRKVQPTCFNALAIIFGLLAIISQSSKLQLTVTPIPGSWQIGPWQLGLDIAYIMLGLECLMPFSTSLYCILQTVVSFKTKRSMRSGKIIRALRIFTSFLLTLTACHLIITHVLPQFEISFFDDNLAQYYQYIYWSFEGLVVFFIIGYAVEFRRIAMCCGCCGPCCRNCCKKRANRRVTPLDDDLQLTAIGEGV